MTGYECGSALHLVRRSRVTDRPFLSTLLLSFVQLTYYLSFSDFSTFRSVIVFLSLLFLRRVFRFSFCLGHSYHATMAGALSGQINHSLNRCSSIWFDELRSVVERSWSRLKNP